MNQSTNSYGLAFQKTYLLNRIVEMYVNSVFMNYNDWFLSSLGKVIRKNQKEEKDTQVTKGRFYRSGNRKCRRRYL